MYNVDPDALAERAPQVKKATFTDLNIQQHHLSLWPFIWDVCQTLLLLIYWRNVPSDVKQWCRPQPFLDTSSCITHVEPLNPLSLEVALNALRNPPVPNGSGSIEKSTVVGLPVRAITDMSKLKISAEVVVSVMSFPNFSMSTTDRLCGTNLHGIWNDALWGTDVTAAPVFPCPAFSPWEMSLIYRFRRPPTPAETSIGASLTLPSMNRPWILFNVGNCFTEEQESPCSPASASQDIVSDIP